VKEYRQRTIQLNVARCAMVLMLAAAMVACNGGTNGVTQPGFTLTPTTSSIDVELGSSASVEVAIGRTGGYAGAVTLEVLGLPAGITSTIAGAGAGSSATVSFAASPSATLGAVNDVTLRGTGEGIAQPVDSSLTLVVTAPPPTVTIITPGYSGTKQVRQGAGDIELLLEGQGLTGASNPRLLNLTAAGEHLFGTIVESGPTSVRIAFSGANAIPHGAAIGGRTLALATDQGTRELPETIEITPIVFSTSGSDSNVGTFDRPFATFDLESVAAAGDTVVVTAGTHILPQSVLVPSGVRITGVGSVAFEPGVSALGVGLFFLGDAEVSNLVLRGFDTGIIAYQGEITLTDVTVEFSEFSAMRLEAMSGPADQLIVKAYDSTFVSSAGDSITVSGGTRFEMHGGESSDNGWTGLYVLGSSPHVELVGVRIAGNGQAGTFPDGIEINMSIDGTVIVRDSVIEDNVRHGVLVLDGGSIDFGTGASPGGNDLQGNGAYQFADDRPARAAADGQIITVLGSRLGGRSDLGGLQTGPASYELAGVSYWRILEANNRMLLPTSP
jgi:hypothetical protein